MSKLYYNTNGFAFHRLDDAVDILGELGYDGVAITPDVHHLDPFHATSDDVDALRDRLAQRGLSVLIETGARYLLDPRRKHWPTLLDEPRRAVRRIDHLCRCIDLAVRLDAPVVSLWSGVVPPDVENDEGYERLIVGLHTVCSYADERGVRIGFEPEPGMLVERVGDWPRIRDAVDHAALGLTLDVGHCLAVEGEPTPQDAIEVHGDDLVLVHLDDHAHGKHEHLAFGQGAVNFDAIARALTRVSYSGPLEVELSGHSSRAPATAAASLRFLRERFQVGEALA